MASWSGAESVRYGRGAAIWFVCSLLFAQGIKEPVGFRNPFVSPRSTLVASGSGGSCGSKDHEFDLVPSRTGPWTPD